MKHPLIIHWPIRKQLIPALALSFWAMTPLTTFVLLWLKGFPTFADSHLGQVMVWVYEVTWAPSLLSAVILALLVLLIIKRTEYFHRPYDFGRCFSLGAILGAGAHAGSTWLYRSITQHPFSGFWLAGALIAGSLTGAFLCSFYLRHASTPPKG